MSALAETTPPIEPVVVNRLRTVTPTSALHLTLVDAVRRLYRLYMYRQNADRKDKMAMRANLPGQDAE